MRLARARARIASEAEQLRAIVAMDVVRYASLASRVATVAFDPALEDGALEAEDMWLTEAMRLVENAQAAMVRLHRHLGTADG